MIETLPFLEFRPRAATPAETEASADVAEDFAQIMGEDVDIVGESLPETGQVAVPVIVGPVGLVPLPTGAATQTDLGSVAAQSAPIVPVSEDSLLAFMVGSVGTSPQVALEKAVVESEETSQLVRPLVAEGQGVPVAKAAGPALTLAQQVFDLAGQGQSTALAGAVDSRVPVEAGQGISPVGQRSITAPAGGGQTIAIADAVESIVPVGGGQGITKADVTEPLVPTGRADGLASVSAVQVIAPADAGQGVALAGGGQGKVALSAGVVKAAGDAPTVKIENAQVAAKEPTRLPASQPLDRVGPTKDNPLAATEVQLAPEPAQSLPVAARSERRLEFIPDRAASIPQVPNPVVSEDQPTAKTEPVVAEIGAINAPLDDRKALKDLAPERTRGEFFVETKTRTIEILPSAWPKGPLATGAPAPVPVGLFGARPLASAPVPVIEKDEVETVIEPEPIEPAAGSESARPAVEPAVISAAPSPVSPEIMTSAPADWDMDVQSGPHSLASGPASVAQPTQTGPVDAPLPPEAALIQTTAQLVVLQAEDRAEIMLEPVELGRLRFEITQRGEGVQIVLMAERPETLELLRRNADQLLGDLNSMGFSGSDLGFGQWSEGPQPQQTTDFDDINEEEPTLPAPQRFAAAHSARSSAGGLDLRL